MIPRQVKLQVLAFVVISVLGVGFVGLRYVGLADLVVGGPFVVRADFAESGGIFTNAAVTYRGVQVGRVGELRLVPGGVRVDLRLDRGAKVPASAHAVVANRSAVGEQYVDLRPETAEGPYLREASVIPRSRTRVPLAVEVLMSNLDKLVNSVDRQDLAVVIDELGRAFDGAGPALGGLIDDQHLLLTDAEANLPQTIALIRDGQTVLSTQLASSSAIRSWAQSLASLSTQLRASDRDIRRLLANGPAATGEMTALLNGLRPSLGFLLGNLIVVGQIQARRLDGLQQILVTYPAVVAGGMTVVPGDGTAHFGLVLNADDPPPCVYSKSGQRTCSEAELARGSGVRGDRRAPRPGGSEPGPAPQGPRGPEPSGAPPGAAEVASVQGGGVHDNMVSFAGFDPATGLALGPDGQPLQLGSTGGQRAVLGEQSWKALLLGPLAA
jgi:phospholipid/cholesterol/gamma-HCH transport system substrate-binding protein